MRGPSLLAIPIVLSRLSRASIGDVGVSLPGCAASCWNDSMYVSLCSDDWACLCAEADYQNCIYAQCDVNEFGAAVHDTIRQCAEKGIHIRLTTISSDRHEELKRREREYTDGHVVLDASGVPTESGGLPTVSISFATMSNVDTAPAPTEAIPSPTSTATPVVPLSEFQEGTPTSITPFLFTGAAARLESDSGSVVGGVIIAYLVGFYLVLLDVPIGISYIL